MNLEISLGKDRQHRMNFGSQRNIAKMMSFQMSEMSRPFWTVKSGALFIGIISPCKGGQKQRGKSSQAIWSMKSSAKHTARWFEGNILEIIEMVGRTREKQWWFHGLPLSRGDLSFRPEITWPQLIGKVILGYLMRNIQIFEVSNLRSAEVLTDGWSNRSWA